MLYCLCWGNARRWHSRFLSHAGVHACSRVSARICIYLEQVPCGSEDESFGGNIPAGQSVHSQRHATLCLFLGRRRSNLGVSYYVRSVLHVHVLIEIRCCAVCVLLTTDDHIGACI